MKKIINIQGAGGVAGIGLARCLKDKYLVTGYDDGMWARQMMEIPEAGPAFTDLVIPVPDSLVSLYSGSKRTFLPHPDDIDLCQDKSRLAAVLGDIAPATHWVRDIIGAGGKGAQMASEYLPGRNYSVELVFNRGELCAIFMKERLSYVVKERNADVRASGSSAVSICIDDPELLTLALTAIHRVKSVTGHEPHGFYGIDFKENAEGVPKVTEINAGRLLTASYVYYYKTGYNLPLIGAEQFFGTRDLPPMEYPLGYGVIRQADQEPRLFTPDQTKEWK